MILTREKKETWNAFEKISFRFLCIYFCLYIFGGFIAPLFKSLVYWTGKNIFNISYDYVSNGYGSGDTTYAYIQAFIFLCLSILGTIFWTSIDFKRKSYNDIRYIFLIILRCYLIFFMMIYGMIKVFHMQMIPPTYSRLLQPLGEMSPMGLAWTFMGFSKGYSIFAGALEVLAGILLISRRTLILGALVTMGVMTQVFIMNLCFDIPVKLFSFHLLFGAFVIFLSGSKRFINGFLLNKKVEKENVYPTNSKEAKGIIRIAKVAFLALTIGFISLTNLSRGEKFVEKFNPVLEGVWEVSNFNLNGRSIPPLLTDKKRWRYLIIDVKEKATVKLINDDLKFYIFKPDTVAKKIDIRKKGDSISNWMKYSVAENKMKLNGILNKDTLSIELNRKTKKDYLLTSRGFNWINERPFNR